MAFPSATSHASRFYRDMARAEQKLREDPEAWRQYTTDRDQWLTAPLDKPPSND